MTTLRLGVLLLFFTLLVIVSGADTQQQETAKNTTITIAATETRTTTVATTKEAAATTTAASTPPPPPPPTKTTTTTTTTAKVTLDPKKLEISTTPATTTVAPVLLAGPVAGKWNYSENNHTCIIVEFTVEMTFTYKTNDNKTNSTTLYMPPVNLTTVHGLCNSTNQSISIDWKSSMNQDNEFTLMFTSEEKSGEYSLSEIRVTIDPNDLPNITTNESLTFVHKHKQYPTKKDNSYRCKQIQKFDLDRHNDTQGYVKISNLQLQAFMTTNTTNFGLAQDCPFDTPDYVPITVGCALAGLVVIVLIAYLVGRRRNQAQGYLSM